MAAKSFPVEASHILMFARSVGDDNPVYADADAAKKTEAGGIIAPPTFAQASAQFDPDYFLRPKPGQPWFGSGKNPTGVARAGRRRRRRGGGGGGGLHAEQHFEYHRHLRPGDVLTATTKPARPGSGRASAPASWCSPRASPNTATRRANWSSPPAASASAPNARSTKTEATTWLSAHPS